MIPGQREREMGRDIVRPSVGLNQERQDIDEGSRQSTYQEDNVRNIVSQLIIRALQKGPTFEYQLIGHHYLRLTSQL